MGKPGTHVVVCTNNRPPGHPRGSCTARGAHDVFQRFFDEVERLSLSREVLVTGSTCTGPCEHGPVVVVHPGTAFYGNVKEPDVARILESHARGEQVTELLLPESAWDEP